MKHFLLLGLTLVASAGAGLAQTRGGAGGYGGSASSYDGSYNRDSGGSPIQQELAKRQPSRIEQVDLGTSTFIEASVLMNVEADEYVAVFGVMAQGKSPAEATSKVDTTLESFKKLLYPLGIAEKDTFVDFITQNRVYAYNVAEREVTEFLDGFEVKKNISIRFKDKKLVDKLVVVASQVDIYDLIKVDYAVKDTAAIQTKLQAQTYALIREKAERYQELLGIKLPPPTQVVMDKPSTYYPVEQYRSYTAAESQSISSYPSNLILRNARKSRTTFFQPLDGNGYDRVINPVILEPVVQFTTYVKVRYFLDKVEKPTPVTGFGGAR